MRTTLTTALLLATVLGLGATGASAQGTPEQREACTPDAIRLCQDTIPDVGRTTACMAAHRAELSARCQAVFDAGARHAAPRTRVARAPAQLAPIAPAARPRREARIEATRAEPAPRLRHMHARVARGDRDTREARRVIGKLCMAQVLSGDTCGFMGRVLTLAE